jgi:hypothetical protein
MRVARAALAAGLVAAVLYLMLDSGVVSPERAPAATSFALLALGLLFGVGAWAMSAGGRTERSPFLAGLAAGVGGYALARLVVF